jgi:DNA-binding protein HU-beta
VNKQELIEAVQKKAGIETKKQSGEAVDAVFEAISATLKKGGKVTLIGFGNFSVAKKKARIGRNPQTGAEMKIPARKVPKFTSSKALKEVVNK